MATGSYPYFPIMSIKEYLAAINTEIPPKNKSNNNSNNSIKYVLVVLLVSLVSISFGFFLCLRSNNTEQNALQQDDNIKQNFSNNGGQWIMMSKKKRPLHVGDILLVGQVAVIGCMAAQNQVLIRLEQEHCLI